MDNDFLKKGFIGRKLRLQLIYHLLLKKLGSEREVNVNFKSFVKSVQLRMPFNSERKIKEYIKQLCLEHDGKFILDGKRNTQWIKIKR